MSRILFEAMEGLEEQMISIATPLATNLNSINLLMEKQEKDIRYFARLKTAGYVLGAVFGGLAAESFFVDNDTSSAVVYGSVSAVDVVAGLVARYFEARARKMYKHNEEFKVELITRASSESCL